MRREIFIGGPWHGFCRTTDSEDGPEQEVRVPQSHLGVNVIMADPSRDADVVESETTTYFDVYRRFRITPDFGYSRELREFADRSTLDIYVYVWNPDESLGPRRRAETETHPAQTVTRRATAEAPLEPQLEAIRQRSRARSQQGRPGQGQPEPRRSLAEQMVETLMPELTSPEMIARPTDDNPMRVEMGVDYGRMLDRPPVTIAPAREPMPGTLEAEMEAIRLGYEREAAALFQAAERDAAEVAMSTTSMSQARRRVNAIRRSREQALATLMHRTEDRRREARARHEAVPDLDTLQYRYEDDRYVDRSGRSFSAADVQRAWPAWRPGSTTRWFNTRALEAIVRPDLRIEPLPEHPAAGVLAEATVEVNLTPEQAEQARANISRAREALNIPDPTPRNGLDTSQ